MKNLVVAIVSIAAFCALTSLTHAQSCSPTPPAIPLTDFTTQNWCGFRGLLYDSPDNMSSSNTPPSVYATQGISIAKNQIYLRNPAGGKDTTHGWIVVVAIGQSNWTLEMCNSAGSGCPGTNGNFMFQVGQQQNCWGSESKNRCRRLRLGKPRTCRLAERYGRLLYRLCLPDRERDAVRLGYSDGETSSGGPVQGFRPQSWHAGLPPPQSVDDIRLRQHTLPQPSYSSGRLGCL